MANEIRAILNSPGTVYARILNKEGKVWNGSAFETYAAANYSTYDIAMTEQGNSGVYFADFPTAITTGGTYEHIAHKQAGGAAAEGDIVIATGKVDWWGTVSVTAGAGAMTGADFLDYVIRNGFKRDDKDTELFEATTDVIQTLRGRFSFDEAEVEATSTDKITVLGDFKIDIESDLGLLISIIMEDQANAHPLLGISKHAFDRLYPDHNVSNDRGYPKHYTIYAEKIYIGPIPDQVSYSYRLNYSRRAGTIVSSTTGVPFTNLYRRMIFYGVMAQLNEGLEEFDKAQYFEVKFEAKYLEAHDREEKNSDQGTFSQEYRDC